jgi:hypothetical protein
MSDVFGPCLAQIRATNLLYNSNRAAAKRGQDALEGLKTAKEARDKLEKDYNACRQRSCPPAGGSGTAAALYGIGSANFACPPSPPPLIAGPPPPAVAPPQPLPPEPLPPTTVSAPATPAAPGECPPGGTKHQCVYISNYGIGGTANVMNVCVPPQGYGSASCFIDGILPGSMTVNSRTGCEPPKSYSELEQRCKEVRGDLSTSSTGLESAALPEPTPGAPATGLKSAVLPVEPLPPVTLPPPTLPPPMGPSHTPAVLPPVTLPPPTGPGHTPAVLPRAVLPPPRIASTPRGPDHVQPAPKKKKQAKPKPRRPKTYVNRSEPEPQRGSIDPAVTDAVIGIIGSAVGGSVRRGGGGYRGGGYRGGGSRGGGHRGGGGGGMSPHR